MSFFRGPNIVTRANKISEFTINTAEYGASVPEIYGTTRIGGNIIYYDDFTAHEHKETHRAGKGGGKQTNITYTYSVATIIGLCEGQIAGIGRIWKDKEVYNYPAEDVGLSLFDGASTQAPWSYVAQHHPDKSLPYGGLAYMAGVIDLGDSAAMPTYNFEVRGKLLSTGDGVDVNPADYIRALLDRVGLSDVAIENLDEYRKYCKEADLLISTPADADESAVRDIVKEITGLTNAHIFWSNDRYKIVITEDRPAGNWMPDKTVQYDLTADDFIPQSDGALVTYQRKDSADIYNRFPVEFSNRANSYEKESVAYQFSEDIANHGLRQANIINARYVYTKERAVKVAEMAARKNKYGRNQYTFTLDWAFCRIEPGDLVRISDKYSGIDKQVARVTAVTEDDSGMLTVTAVSVPPGNYSAATYDVHDVDRPYIEYNKTAPDTIPVIFQPPADLTADGLELWIAAKGKAEGWGGCTVYVSDDNTNYRTVGQIAGSARCGKLIQNIAKNDTDVIVSCNDQLISGTPQDAERKNTLCWIGGECLSYVTATLQSDGRYKLSGCIRGQYNTKVTAHNAGADFIRLDNALLHLNFAKEDIGKKIYLKFCSYNIFGAGQQDLSEVKAYEYTLQKYYIPPVQNITAYNRYRQLADGVSRYDIVVNWTPPELQSYLQGDVWYKTSNGQAKDLVIKEGTKGSELGFDGEWTFGGSGKDQVVIPQAIVGDTYLIAVCTKDEWGEATSPDTSPQLKILVALKTEIPNTPDGFEINFGSTCTASWKEVTNADIAFYEVRTDQSPGAETSGLLARTNNLSAILPLTERRGALYLYAKSAIGKYSAPAILQYNKPVPKKPNPPVLTSTIGGFGLTAEAIPVDCAGMNIYINGTDGQKTIKTENSSYSHTCGAGIYDVSIAYYDLFGEGEKSGESRVVVKISISKDMLEDEAISLEKVDKLIKKKLEEGAIAKQDVTTIVSNLGNLMLAKANYSAIAQMQDAINLRVQKGDVINQINLSPTTTTINGKYLHVTGQTVFDNNVIVSRMLAAKAVTADKLAVTSLSAITANIGLLRTKTSGARMEIKDNLIEAYGPDNKRYVRMGVW